MCEQIESIGFVHGRFLQGEINFHFWHFFLLIIVKRPCLLGLGFHILFVNNKNTGSGPTQSPALHYHNKCPNCVLIYFILKKKNNFCILY